MHVWMKFRRCKTFYLSIAILLTLLAYMGCYVIGLNKQVVSVNVFLFVDSNVIDHQRISREDIHHWVKYLEYAGVNRIYFYHAYEHSKASLAMWARNTFPPEELVYNDWSLYQHYDVIEQKDMAFSHVVANYGERLDWIFMLDINDYPFSKVDQRQGFLQRLLLNEIHQNSNLSQLILHNVQFVGQDSEGKFIHQRMTYRKVVPEVEVFRQMFKVQCSSIEIIENEQIGLSCGPSKILSSEVMRINQYRVTTLEDWMVDSINILDHCVHDDSALDIQIL